MLTIGNVIESGFRLIREHPLAVVVWGAIIGLGQLGSLLLMRPIYAMQAGTVSAGGPPAPFAMLSAMLPLYGYQFLFFLVMTVIWTAAFRAILRPAESSAAYLRLGMDELRVIGLTLLVGVLFYIAIMVVTVVMIGLGFMAFGANNRGAGVALILIFSLAILCFSIWFMVRMSLAGPLTVYRREFTLGDGWRLSKGHFWTLFVGYLVIGVLLFVFSMIVSTLTMGSYWLDLMRNITQPGAMQAAAQAQADRLSGFSPMLILMVLGSGVSGALWMALGAGAAAGATRQLIGADNDDIEDVFA